MTEILVLQFELKDWDNVPLKIKGVLTDEVHHLIDEGYYPYFIVPAKNELNLLIPQDEVETIASNAKTVICFRKSAGIGAIC